MIVFISCSLTFQKSIWPSVEAWASREIKRSSTAWHQNGQANSGTCKGTQAGWRALANWGARPQQKGMQTGSKGGCMGPVWPDLLTFQEKPETQVLL